MYENAAIGDRQQIVKVDQYVIPDVEIVRLYVENGDFYEVWFYKDTGIPNAMNGLYRPGFEH